MKFQGEVEYTITTGTDETLIADITTRYIVSK